MTLKRRAKRLSRKERTGLLRQPKVCSSGASSRRPFAHDTRRADLADLMRLPCDTRRVRWIMVGGKFGLLGEQPRGTLMSTKCGQLGGERYAPASLRRYALKRS